jgi:hypothetical protein
LSWHAGTSTKDPARCADPAAQGVAAAVALVPVLAGGAMAVGGNAAAGLLVLGLGGAVPAAARRFGNHRPGALEAMPA